MAGSPAVFARVRKAGRCGDRRRSHSGLIVAIGLLFLCACKPGKAPTPPAIEQQEAQWDATVWRNEIRAQGYERTFVRLADEMRAAPDKSDVLARFEFEKILLPGKTNVPLAYPLGIHRQRLAGTNGIVLDQHGWRKAIGQFHDAGWRIAQTEWRHEKFRPATNASPAWSEFEFELHGEQTASSNRFILQGTMEIQWAAGETLAGLKKPRIITVTKLDLLERSGPPGFDNHLLVAPEPNRPDGVVNLQPLIVSDINGDGHDDIILPGINAVLLNDGHGQFDKKPFIAPQNFYGLKDTGVLADFDGDGRLDYLGVAEGGPLDKMLVLYRGDGSIPFTALPVAAWQQQQSDWPRYHFQFASAITAGDIDGDGDLDLFVGQYRQPYLGGNLPTPYYDANDGFPSYLLLNDGHGRFSQAPLQSALLAKGHRRMLAASFVDLDLDGDLDLVTVNDFCGVDLFYNDGHGHFTDETARLENSHLFGMAHCIADFDGDGRPDLLAIGMSLPTVDRLEFMKAGRPDLPDRNRMRKEMSAGNRLYTRRDARWVEPSFGQQLARTGWSWGATALDMDDDGKLDVYIANGHVSGASAEDYDSHYWTHDIYLGNSQEDPVLQRYLTASLSRLNSGQTSWNGYQHNVLFQDVGTNEYVNTAFLMGVAHESDCRAVVSADLNDDGKPDLLVVEAHWDGSPHRMQHRLLVHLNQLQTTNHWIGIRLSSNSAVSPIGAKAFVRTEDRLYYRQIITGDSFQAQHPNTFHFGLGPATRVKELTVVWPNGTTNAITNPAIDRYHLLSP